MKEITLPVSERRVSRSLSSTTSFLKPSVRFDHLIATTIPMTKSHVRTFEYSSCRGKIPLEQCSNFCW